MAFTYPVPAPTISTDYETVHRLLQNPTLIARRLRTLAEQRFIADTLLTGRFATSGGSIWYEQPGESIYTNDTPEAVQPNAEYPLTTHGIGATAVATVVKWGQDVIVTDEAIKRLNRNPVDRSFVKLVNQMVKTIDGIALSAITSAVTQTVAAAAQWTTAATAKQIFSDVAKAKQDVIDLNQGYDPNVVVLPSAAWVAAMATFTDAGYLPREDRSTPALTGQFPVIDGMIWLTSPNVPSSTTAYVVDTNMLGGMADEQLGGPGYAGSAAGVEVKSIRNEEQDGWRLRARRITVPVVIEPNACKKITGVA